VKLADTAYRRLHAARILPGVRGDLLVFLLLILLAAASLATLRDTLRSTRKPEPVSLARLLGPGPIANPHVETSGRLVPRVHLDEPAPGRTPKPVTSSYLALIDAEAPEKLLLVRYPGDLGHGEPRRVAVAGMLQPPDRALARRLDAANWTIAGLPVERRYILMAGLEPGSAWMFAVASLASVGLGSALAVAMIRGLAPRRHPSQPAEAATP
jgi:hypothetical protein